MKKLFVCFVLLITFIYFENIKARPISYQGGWTLMQKNNFNKHSIHLHYTPSIKYSLGYKGEYWLNKEWQFHGAQLNFLLKRLNKPKSQANFYIKTGAGAAFSDYKNFDGKVEPLLFSGISADWEDRRYFISYENRINYSNKIVKSFLQKSRIGITPYLGEYGDLHTWFMLEVDHMPNSINSIIYTPMVRMFKGDYLAEAGITNYGDLMFNFIKRF